MTEPASDPRVYLAAERTVLAWIRTGIAIMASGFVVARFGLFLRLLRAHGQPFAAHGLSPYVGGALVGLGVVATAGGAIRYQRFCKTIPPGDRPASSGPSFALALSGALVVAGLALGVVLAV